jgi:hypothetical protein
VSYRVTVTASGEVVVESSGAAETAALVKELRSGRARGRAGSKARTGSKRKLELESEDVPLSAQLVETWNWLVKHDSAEGVHHTDIATALGIKPATAIYRLNQLQDKELAHKTHPGRYRAGG